LIRILIKHALETLRIPITWIVFINLPVEDDIKTITYNVSPSVNEDEARQGKEDIELDGDKMDEEETNTEEHDEREHKEDDVEIEEEMKEETDGDEKEQQKEEDKKKIEDNCRKRKTN